MPTTEINYYITNGESICYETINRVIEGRWIVKYENKYYLIKDNYDREKNTIKEISESEAKEILSNYIDNWEEAQRMWGWEDLDVYLGKK